MDKNFLEFWGNLIIGIARGQKQMEDMTRWLNQDFNGLDSLMAAFKKVYGLEQVSPATGKSEELWNRQLKSLQDSFQEYLKFLFRHSSQFPQRGRRWAESGCEHGQGSDGACMERRKYPTPTASPRCSDYLLTLPPNTFSRDLNGD